MLRNRDQDSVRPADGHFNGNAVCGRRFTGRYLQGVRKSVRADLNERRRDYANTALVSRGELTGSFVLSKGSGGCRRELFVDARPAAEDFAWTTPMRDLRFRAR
jgi:hypothetical protein